GRPTPNSHEVSTCAKNPPPVATSGALKAVGTAPRTPAITPTSAGPRNELPDHFSSSARPNASIDNAIQVAAPTRTTIACAHTGPSPPARAPSGTSELAQAG